MNRTTLKNYAPQARRDCIAAVTDRAASYGLRHDRIEPMTEQGEVVLITGISVPRNIATKRKRLEDRITRHGFEPTMEAIAYTWFNRFVAIRFMELHGYLEHGYRVLSHPDPDKPIPEILEHAAEVELPGLNPNTVIELKLDGTRDPELYRMLVLAQCNALHAAMPFLFERIDDETELLLPENLLHSDSLIRKLVNGIDEEDWQDVEIIGWLYQFYIAEKKDQVIGKVVKSEDIPAATQLFTPNWIVKYLVQNSLGRQWLATYPDSPLKQQMEYYIEPAEQTPDVQAQLKAITPDILNPEELTLLDPACSSGHILVEAYDLFKAIYQERGYRARDIPALILQKNLFGLEIDDRAAQLAAFALMMKARADDRRIFANDIQPHVLAIQESEGLNAQQITEALNRPFDAGEKQGQQGNITQADMAQLITLFEQGKTFGSLIRVPEHVAEKLPAIAQRAQEVLVNGGMLEQAAARLVEPLIGQAQLLAIKYGAVVTNPPYMGTKYYNTRLKKFVLQKYKQTKGDLYACFVVHGMGLLRSGGFIALITIPTWMFISTFEVLRLWLLKTHYIDTFLDNGRGVFGSDFGSCSFVIRNASLPNYQTTYRRLTGKRGSVASNEELQSRFTQRDDYFIAANELAVIPGSPIAYLVSSAVRNAFKEHQRLDSAADFVVGLFTCNNDRFLRYWHEIDFSTIGFGCNSCDEADSSRMKWFPHHKGGSFRKWFGNCDYVVYFPDNGKEISEYRKQSGQSYSLPGHAFYFREGVTWSHTTASFFSARFSEGGSISNVEGPTLFTNAPEIALAFLCSSVSQYFMKLINPTFHYRTGNVASLPFDRSVIDQVSSSVKALSRECIDLAKADWDSSETSWDFKQSPWIWNDECSMVQESANVYLRQLETAQAQMKKLEYTINVNFINAYNLKHEVEPDVADEQITLTYFNREEDIKRLLSYAIGGMMGRYSLDTPGLIYAHSGNDRFWDTYHEKHERHEKDKTGNFSYDSCLSWSTFPADSDGIIPIMETDWFPDDASNRLVEFISVVWSKEHLGENLTFIAESLGPNRSEQPQETIRRYFATGFYKHHLQMYKRRPIYWLFSSGKQRAFQCLVYLHRYHEGTLARMRTEYVIPLQGKIAARIDQLADDIAAASSTAYRKKLEKERETIRKQHTELRAFDEQLRHYADRRIRLDLDDGVKVNYGKFGDLLADVKAVTGSSEES